MSLNTETREITGVVTRLLDNLVLTALYKSGADGIALRSKIGTLRANYLSYIKAGTFASALLDCFTAAVTAKVELAGLTKVHLGLFAETPIGDISVAIVQTATVFCLSAESRLFMLVEFVSRDVVDTTIRSVAATFNTAKELAADSIDSSAYRSLTSLGGALINYLANAARPLPKMVTFNMPAALPALTLSNRVYYTAERWSEIVDENNIVHPAFCPRDIRGLAS